VTVGYPYPPQQPQWQQPGGYAQPPASPALAIIAAVLGLAVAGSLGYQTIDLLADMPSGAEWPGEFVTLVVLHFVVVALALLGAILVFARQLAGAFLLLAGGLLAVVMVLVDPLIFEDIGGTMIGALPDLSATSKTGAYYELLFEFGNEQAVLRVVALFAGVLVAILAALPPSLKWLRKPPATGYQPPTW